MIQRVLVLTSSESDLVLLLQTMCIPLENPWLTLDPSLGTTCVSESESLWLHCTAVRSDFI